MRILLIQPPLEDFYTTPIRFYPLGLLYAGRVLEKAGCTVHIVDCLTPLRKIKVPVPSSFSYLPPLTSIPHFFKRFYRFGIKDEEIVSRIKTFAPDLVGVSSQFTAYYESVAKLVSLIKKNAKVPVFVGGNHATAFPRDIKSRTPEIDFVLTGPAEECLSGFLNALKAESCEEEIDWRESPPAHHLLDGADYRIGKKNYISLSASRGCPFYCDFCSVHRMFGRKIEYRRVESVLEEMRWNHAQRQTRLFNFEDDNISFDRGWFMEFLKAVAGDPVLEGIELTAMNGLCFQTLDEEMIKAMHQAGFRELNLSLISQSGELQRTYHRPYYSDSFDRFSSLVGAAKKMGLFVTAYIILGLPGQTYEEAKETIDSLLELGVLVGPSVFYLSPGSRLYERMKILPQIKDDWNLYRSSAFAVETDELSRPQLLQLFSYVREKNLERRGKTENSINNLTFP